MKRAIAMADNCIDVYYKLDRYYLTGNSIDFALNYRDLGGDVTEMTILGNDVFAMALEERLKERGIALRVLKRVWMGIRSIFTLKGMPWRRLNFQGRTWNL